MKYSSPSWSRIDAGICVLLFLAVWFAFGPAVGFDFINFDDPGYVVGNPHIRNGITLDGLRWALTNSHGGNWHPLTSLSHMLDCELFGLNAAGHHAVNLLLHAVNAVLLFLVFLLFTNRRRCSAAVAFLFAVHPLRVESVVWIAERKDVLSGLFFMLTLLAYAPYARKEFAWRRYLAVAAFLLAGLLSKPMLVTLPAVLLLLDFWPLKRLTGMRPWLEKLPLFALSLAACLATLWAQDDAMQMFEVPPFYRAANATVAYVVYLRQLVWPAGLALVVPHPGTAVSLWTAAACMVFLAAVTAATWLLRNEKPWLLTGWLWYAGMLVPVIGLVQVGVQAHADRYTYLPMIGISVMIVWSLARQKSVVVNASALLIAAALIISTRMQVHVWENNQSLWKHTLAHTQNNFTAWINLGTALFEDGDAAGAERCFSEALRIKPDDVEGLCNLGLLRVAQGRIDCCIELMERALAVKPDRFETLKALGGALILQGQLEEGVTLSLRALELNPQDEAVARNIAVARRRLQQEVQP